MDEHVDFKTFLNRLRGLIAERQSVVMQLVTDDRHYACVGLDRGTVVSITYGPWRGASAVPRVAGITGGRLSLRPPTDLRPQPNLASTPELLAALEAAVPISPSTTRPTSQQPSANPSNGSVDPRQVDLALTKVRRLLPDYLGPVAEFALSDALQTLGEVTSLDDVERLARVIGQDIDDPVRAERFIDEALQVTRG